MSADRLAELDHLLDWIGAKLLWLAGLVAALSAAVVGQAELIGEPWHHYLSVAGIVAVAVVAYLMPQYRTLNAHSREDDPSPSWPTTPRSGAKP